jgi:hypothetical protein
MTKAAAPRISVPRRSADEPVAKALARELTRPEVRAAQLLHTFTDGADDDLDALVREMAEQSAKVQAGDLSRCEAILTSQVHTLDALFHRLLTRCAQNMGTHIESMDIYLRLALRVQAQTRSSIETLGMLHNPTVFVKGQANISKGPQQVNNHGSGRARARSKILAGELSNELHPNTGTPPFAIGNDSTMAPMGTVNRSANTARKRGV